MCPGRTEPELSNFASSPRSVDPIRAACQAEPLKTRMTIVSPEYGRQEDRLLQFHRICISPCGLRGPGLLRERVFLSRVVWGPRPHSRSGCVCVEIDPRLPPGSAELCRA